MYAAVVTSFDTPPSYQEFPTPTPHGSDEELVDVVASGLHRRVRPQADRSPSTRSRLSRPTGSDDRRPLAWIEVGSIAGPTAAIRSAALRALPSQIVGSGQRSVSTAEILAELPALVAEIGCGALRIDAQPTPTDVTSAWQGDSDARVVLTP